MADLSRRLGRAGVAQRYRQEADSVAQNFRRRFWHQAAGYLYDVIDGPEGDLGPDGRRYDASLRPNQIMAVALPFELLSQAQAKGVVDVCARQLWTSYGLRSLAADHPAYVGGYGGGPRQRDGAYHQGTVWGWLLGQFATAHYRVYGDAALARSFLAGAEQHLAEACLGSVSEIFDGDPPHTPRGCFAQAWSVAEILRAWQELAIPLSQSWEWGQG
jgi:glycogen debranching enzyme